MTGLRTQRADECVAYGTLAALESMLKIHYYNDAAKEFDLSEDDLLAAMGDIRSVENACNILKNNGITIPDRSAAYKIAGSSYINSEGMNSVETIIAKAKVYLETNGPIIAKYNDDVIGSHCLAIVGYTDAGNWICKDSWPLNNGVPYHNSSSTWNTDGTCKIHDANGGYREINADYMIGNLSGELYAILIQELRFPIKNNDSGHTSINNWTGGLLRIRKKFGDTYTNLELRDPTSRARFVAKNPGCNVSIPDPNPDNMSFFISPPTNLDNLVVDAAPGEYDIDVHICVNGSNYYAHAGGTVGDSSLEVEILLNTIQQCAREILYPFALDAMEKNPSDDAKTDINVALRLLLRTAEISKEEFIADLERRLVDLDKAHGCGIDGALEIRRATEEIRKLVRSMED
jgi:hypothetical protein